MPVARALNAEGFRQTRTYLTATPVCCGSDKPALRAAFTGACCGVARIRNLRVTTISHVAHETTRVPTACAVSRIPDVYVM